MTQQPDNKYTLDYKVVLYAVILRCVEKQTAGEHNQVARDAKYIAHQQLRLATDEVKKQSDAAARQTGRVSPP